MCTQAQAPPSTPSLPPQAWLGPGLGSGPLLWLPGPTQTLPGPAPRITSPAANVWAVAVTQLGNSEAAFERQLGKHGGCFSQVG